MRTAGTVVLIVTMAATTALAGPEPVPADSEKTPELPPIVVTPTRTERDRVDVPASVSVITARDIEESFSFNPDDLLRQLPGVSVMRSTGIGQGMANQIHVRGVPGDHRVLFLEDGLPLNEIHTGFLSLNEIPMDAIERVEVIKGPFSCLYGTDAFGGVVNIITRAGGNEPEGSVKAGIGPDGFYDVGVSGSGPAVGGAAYSISVGRRATDNYLARDQIMKRSYDYATGQYVDTVAEAANLDYMDTRAMGRVSFDLGKDTRCDLHARYFESELGFGQKDLRPVYPTVEDDITDMRSAMLGFQAVSTPQSWLHVRGGGYYRSQRRDVFGLDLSHYEGETPVFARSFSRSDSAEWQVEAGADAGLGDMNTLSGGVEVRRSECDFQALKDTATGDPLPGRTGVKSHVINTGVYLQDEAKLGEKFRVVAGVRLDHNSQFGEAVSPRAGVVYKVADGTTVRLSAARAFNAPTLLEMFQPPLDFGGLTFVPNPDLKPEHITATDLEIEQEFGKTLSGRMSVFYNHMTDLVENRVNGMELSNANVGEARAGGVEAGLEWRFADWAKTFLGFTYQDAKDKDTGLDLEYVAETMGNIGVSARRKIGKCRIDGTLTGTYVGRRGFNDWESGQWYDLDPYWRADVSMRATLSECVWLGVGVQNATDEQFQESRMFVQAPGRIVVLEAGARF